jgi:hypothetical protein
LAVHQHIKPDSRLHAVSRPGCRADLVSERRLTGCCIGRFPGRFESLRPPFDGFEVGLEVQQGADLRISACAVLRQRAALHPMRNQPTYLTQEGDPGIFFGCANHAEGLGERLRTVKLLTRAAHAAAPRASSVLLPTFSGLIRRQNWRPQLSSAELERERRQ